MDHLRTQKKELKSELRKQTETVREIRSRVNQYEHHLGFDRLPESELECLEATFLLALDKAKQAKARLKVDATVEKLKERLKVYISEKEVDALVQDAESRAESPGSEMPELQVPEPESLEVLESPWGSSAFSETSIS